MSRIDTTIMECNVTDKENECLALDLDSEGASTSNEIQIENMRKRKISETTDYSEELYWETTVLGSILMKIGCI